MTQDEIRTKALRAAMTVALAMTATAGCRHKAPASAPEGATGDSVGDSDVDDGRPDCTQEEDADGIRGCCEDLRAWCTARFPDHERQSVCIFGEDLGGQSTGCIPWGPPAPPAMA